jgi:AcrR family transcriptional regulator
VPGAHDTAAQGPRPRRRADAERNIERILDAAIDALNDDPEASMADIARRAGLVRATIYVHFPSREALLEAMTERAFTHVSADMQAAEPERGSADEALVRVLASTWRTLARYHPLIDINTRQHTHEELHHRHGTVLGALQPLVERGQADGVFRSDVPAAWHLGMFMALVHAASGELRAGRVAEADAEAALVATVLGAVSTHGAAR